VEPTDWFRVRHRDPFPEESVIAFRAACAVYRAKMQAVLDHWTELPLLCKTPKPEVVFFEPEVSQDGRVMSLPVRIDRKTLGSRSLFQSTASSELYGYLPFPVVAGIEVGVTEPAIQGPGWRNDWWSPHYDNSIGPEEAFRRLGFKVRADPGQPGRWHAVPGLRRRLQWFMTRVISRWRGRRTRG
jgi:hypothetical protein